MRYKVLFLMLLCSWGLYATEPAYMRVHQIDNTDLTFLLNEKLILKFANQNMQIITSAATETVAIPVIEKVTFTLPVETAIPEVEVMPTDKDAAVRKVIENGQVVIIKDGVRYNILGMRLAN